MAINGYFFNAVQEGGVYDRVYNAEDVTSYLRQIVGTGVFPGTNATFPNSQLQVKATTGLGVKVTKGEGWIEGHKIVNTADYELTLDSADALLDRIDRIIFYADYSNREMGIAVLKGTAASNPTPAALTRNTTRFEMCLANIRVAKQVTAITQANITDTRADSSVCGWVAGLIQQVDTSSLFTQWQTAYSDYYAQVKQQLDDFMETLTQELAVNTYVQEYRKAASIGQSDSTTITLDMTGYTYEATDVICVYLNGFLGRPTTDYTVNVSGGTCSVTVNFEPTSGITNDVDIRVLKSIIGIEQQLTP